MSASMKTCSHPGCERKHHSGGYCQMHLSRARRGANMDAPHRAEISLADRLWSKVHKHPGDGCWEWTAAHDGRRGYGHINVGGVILKAYRVAYELENGPIPAGVEICHKCDNPKCVRPGHLFVGTHLENMRDGAEKGRMNPGEKNGMAKLKDSDVIVIARRLASGSAQMDSLAAAYGVSRTCIHDIATGRRWSRITAPIFGGHQIAKKHLGHGLYEYLLVRPEPQKNESPLVEQRAS
ncbi:HNH endonuclease signature motif containing protein [Hydrogenophaga pseudoflava]|uniref:HNH endonuclease signature motif containing protein n=1 Tax=Hydrogenophaga pseudoflava TaxID=47421 RepID=UPI0027E3BE9A|nr:HNH endonuclease signature motif containing protein [Hydrogenophaga pseudoflava]MDQ7745424.1 HNH endonuclease signature motif containing protein [Hydrogenophaga pseudoflava]